MLETAFVGVVHEFFELLAVDLGRKNQLRPGGGDELLGYARPAHELVEGFEREFLRLGGVLVYPVRQLFVRGDEFFYQFRVPLQSPVVGDENRRHRILLVEENFCSGVLLQARDPRFNRPHGVEIAALEEHQLLGIGGRYHARLARSECDFHPVVDEPRAAGHVLRIAELRGSYALALEILRGLYPELRVYHERRPAVGGAREYADVAPARLGVGVYGGVGTDVGDVHRPREDRLHRARAGVEEHPLDFHVLAEPFLEPALAEHSEPVRHQRLRVRYIWEVPYPQHGFGARGRAQGGGGNNREGEFSKNLFHCVHIDNN